MQRILLGLLALACLAGGGAIYAWHADHESLVGLGGMLLRVGMLMALIWLAWPDLAQIPFWLVGGMLGVSIAVVWLGGWKALAIAIPAVLAFWFLSPRLQVKPPAK